MRWSCSLPDPSFHYLGLGLGLDFVAGNYFGWKGEWTGRQTDTRQASWEQRDKQACIQASKESRENNIKWSEMFCGVWGRRSSFSKKKKKWRRTDCSFFLLFDSSQKRKQPVRPQFYKGSSVRAVVTWEGVTSRTSKAIKTKGGGRRQPNNRGPELKRKRKQEKPRKPQNQFKISNKTSGKKGCRGWSPWNANFLGLSKFFLRPRGGCCMLRGKWKKWFYYEIINKTTPSPKNLHAAFLTKWNAKSIY